ncbi:hypothetical protein, partial [Kitasatospora herbaricolor]|uniref:hypothetical protein n=1 Tax=Kitasatospora herbaricolor TaxID=68217 RepID=UPI0036DD3F0B
AVIFMHWDGKDGIGVLKYREQGALDVNGDAYVSGKLRLPSTVDLSATSTGHPFQVGADNAPNIGIDANEIMARNNGAVAPLSLNVEGGDILLGNGSTTLKFWGVPFEAAEGAVTGQSVVSGGSTSVTVTFPTGRFSTAPRVTATLLADARDVTVNVDAASTTSVVVRLGSVGAARSGLGFNWIAMRLR